MSQPPSTPDRQASLSRLIRIGIARSAQAVTIAAAGLGAAALIPGVEIPAAWGVLATTVGVEAIGNLLDWMASADASDDEIIQRMEDIVRRCKLDKVLTKDEFYPAFVMIREGQRSLHQDHEQIYRVLQDVKELLQQPSAQPAPAARSFFTISPPPRIFTGRESEVERLVAALCANDGGGPAALIGGVTGGAGIGKTALARVAAHRLRDEYLFAVEIDLKGAARIPEMPLDPAAAARNILYAFFPDQPPPTDPTDVFTLYRKTLSAHKTLLLLDNARDADQVRPLLPPPPSAALITSRTRFRLPEVGLAPVVLDVLSPEQACSLLRELSPRLQGAEDELALAIAERCGRLPLALQVAAALLESRDDWTPEELLRRLNDQRTRLPTLRLPDDASLDVYAALEASYQALPEALQQRYRYLGVFPAPFDRAALAFVWSGEAEMTPTLDADLGILRSRSLVEYNPKTELYMLHDLTRLHAYTHLLKMQDESGEAIRRHADYYLDLASTANKAFQKGKEHIPGALSTFRKFWPHLEEAFQRLAATPPAVDDPEAEGWLAVFPLSIAHLLDLHLPPIEQIPILKRALRASQRIGDRRREGSTLNNLGNAYNNLGKTRQAIEIYEQGLAIAREIGDQQIEGMALTNLGNAYRNLGEFHRAISFYEQAFVIDHKTRDRWGEGNDMNNLGTAYYSLGETHRSVECYNQALNIHQETGNLRGEGDALINLGNAYRDLGETRRAIELFNQALRIAREIGNLRGEGNALTSLGNAYYILGDARHAVEYYEQALRIYQQTGDRRSEGNVLNNLGNFYQDVKELTQARDYYDRALAIFRETNDRQGEGTALGNLGNTHHSLGNVRLAIEFHKRALLIDREIGDRRGEGNDLINLGSAYQDLNETSQSFKCYEQALRIHQQIGDRRGEGNALASLGSAYRDKGELDRARECYQRALRIFEEIESPYAAKVRRLLDELDQGSSDTGETSENERGSSPLV